MKDNVNQPAHYKMGAKETIDTIEEALGREGFTAYCRGNVMKYLARFEYKNGVEDLKKAEWYLKRLIKLHDKAGSLGTLILKHQREQHHGKS